MAYCTRTDIERRLPAAELEQLIDDTDMDPEADKTAIVTRAIADADALIDSYLGVKYLVPLTTVPDIVRTRSVDLAIWNLGSRRWGNMSAPTVFETNYNAAVQHLKDIARGTAVLSVPDPAENTGRTGTTAITSETRVCSRDSLKNLI